MERSQKGPARTLCHVQRCAGHAEAPVNSEDNGQGDIAAGKRFDGLRLLVLKELEVLRPQPKHRALGAGDGDIDLDKLHRSTERGPPLLCGHHGQATETQHGRSPRLPVFTRYPLSPHATWYNLATFERSRVHTRPKPVPVGGKELMGRLGIPELLIILGIVILIFGANRLPELGRGIGRGIKNFKDATRSDSEAEEKS